MSSTRNNSERDDLFKTYIVHQNEGEDAGAEEEKSPDTPASTGFIAYTPKRSSFNSVQGKIKRYFA